MNEVERDMGAIDVAPTITDTSLEYNTELHQAGMVLLSDDPTHGDEVREIAQALHTQVYYEQGWIGDPDLNAAGLYIDKYSERSTYMLAENERRRSACRYIYADVTEGVMSLPTVRYFSIDEEKAGAVAGVGHLSEIQPSEVIEVSGLASIRLDAIEDSQYSEELDATRLMYATILRRSLDAGHKLWLMNIEPKFIRYLNMLIGKEQVHVLGDEVAYMGPATMPVALNPQAVVQAAFADETRFGNMKRQYLLKSLSGVSGKYLTPEVKLALLSYKVEYEDDTRLVRLFRDYRVLEQILTA